MQKTIYAIIGLILGLPAGAFGTAYLFCALWGTGTHMDGCGIAGMFVGLWPGGLVGVVAGWTLGKWLMNRLRLKRLNAEPHSKSPA